MQDQNGHENNDPSTDNHNENTTEINYPPLPDDWAEKAKEISNTFLTSQSPAKAERLCLEKFVFSSLKFAHLEKRIQSEIICDIPASLNTIDEATSMTLLEEAEALANAERISLEIPEGPVEYLVESLDDMGIKVFEWPHPTNDYGGGFLFTDETGPALLVMGPKESPLSQFILAHQYCHLLADNNPYENRFCELCTTPVKEPLALGGRILEQDDFENPFDEITLAETRADLFARCFLVPEKHFRKTLFDFGEKKGPYNLDRLADIAFYYGVTTPLVLNRLVDLELLPLADATTLANQFSQTTLRNDVEKGLLTGPPTQEQEREAENENEKIEALFARLPKRYITLTIALLMKGQISKEQVGYLLDIKSTQLDAFLAWTEEPAGALRAANESEKSDPSTDPGDIMRNLRNRN